MSASNNPLTSSAALHVSVAALQQTIHCLEMHRTGNALLDYDAVKSCSCWQGDSRCPACAHHQSLVDELEAIEAQLADIDDGAFKTDDETDSGSNSSEDSSSEHDSSSTGGDMASHQGSRTSSCSSKPSVPMLSLARVLPEHCETWDADEEGWTQE
jgi:hypothetical protein